MNTQKLAYLYAILAFVFWGGLSPIYFKELESVNSFEVLIYRIVFSVLTLLPFFFLKKEFLNLINILKDITKIKYLFLSTLFISVNWLVFIWAVGNGKILEASLGYYINPLVNVFLGYLIFSEKMNKNQYIAIIIALLAVIYQFIALGYIPMVSLVLATSFGIYGMIRKKIQVSSLLGLFVEVLLLLPFALMYLLYLYVNSKIQVLENPDSYISILLYLAGLMTIIPLILFNNAARNMKLSTLGFFQYIGPSLAFLIAIFIYNEEFNMDKMITFVLIWIALIFFSMDKIKEIVRRYF